MHPTPHLLAIAGAAALVGPLLAVSVAANDPAHAEPIARTAVAGSPTSGDPLFPHQGNSGYDVLHYDVDLSYAATGSITATATIDAVTTDEPLSSYSLDLEGLTVSSVTVDGDPAAFTRLDDAAGTTTHKLVVTPEEPVADGFTTVVTYSGTPVRHTDPDGVKEGWTPTATGAVALGRAVGTMTWLPCNDTLADKASYTTRIRIPAAGPATAAVGNGRLASKTTAAGVTTWTWEQEDDQSPQSALVAIGKYTQVTGNVSVDFDSRSVPQWTYLSAAAAADSTTTATRGRLHDVLDAIGSRYGDYPGSTVGMVVDDPALGYDVATQDRPYFEKSVDLTDLARGYARQWFGDAVTPVDSDDVWLAEGMSGFAATQAAHDLSPSLPDTTATYYGDWSKNAADSALWSVAPAALTDPAQLLGAQARERAAMTMEALRVTVGVDYFYEMMTDWVDSYSGASASTADFIDFVESETGRDLDAFFADWLYDTDKPKWPTSYDLTLASNPPDGSTVAPGDVVTYGLKATNTGKAALTNGTVDVDLTDAFATVGPLPAGLTQDPDNALTLHWAVPPTAVGASSSTTFTMTGLPTETPRDSSVRIQATGIGGDCIQCDSTVRVVPTRPVITGDASVGSTLTAAFDGFGAGQEFHYQWLRDGDSPVGTDAASYVVQTADLGHRLRVRVTATMTATPSVTRSSDDTDTVAGRQQPNTPTPTISGAVKVGQPLVANTPGWQGDTTLTYHWLHNGNPIPGATRTTYRPVPSDLGKHLSVTVTATRSGYETATVTSAPTRAVVAGTQTRRPTVSIKGIPKVGRILRVVTGAHDPGSKLTFRWIVGGRTVPGVTGRTLKVKRSYVGKRVAVVLTATRPGYTTQLVSSSPTKPVALMRP